MGSCKSFSSTRNSWRAWTVSARSIAVCLPPPPPSLAASLLPRRLPAPCLAGAVLPAALPPCRRDSLPPRLTAALPPRLLVSFSKTAEPERDAPEPSSCAGRGWLILKREPLFADEFEDTEENKLIYTEIHRKYVKIVGASVLQCACGVRGCRAVSSARVTDVRTHLLFSTSGLRLCGLDQTPIWSHSVGCRVENGAVVADPRRGRFPCRGWACWHAWRYCTAASLETTCVVSHASSSLCCAGFFNGGVPGAHRGVRHAHVPPRALRRRPMPPPRATPIVIAVPFSPTRNARQQGFGAHLKTGLWGARDNIVDRHSHTRSCRLTHARYVCVWRDAPLHHPQEHHEDIPPEILDTLMSFTDFEVML